MRLHRLSVLFLAPWLGGCVFGDLDLGPLRGPRALEERIIDGKSGPKLAMLDIEGIITDTRTTTRLGALRPSMVARAREALDLAAEDDGVAGLLLRIQSPGGTVSASETLHHEVERWKKETGRPVVAFLQGIATSGGYYVAMAADQVIAHPTTVTGSLGVIMRSLNVSGLMGRLGVSDQSFRSGAFKDAASPFRPMRDEEREQLQSVIDDLHQRFVEVVAAGRPMLAEARIRQLADGRVYSAGQALEAGLVDGIGHLDQAIEAARHRAGISESRVVVYEEPAGYRGSLYLRGPPALQPAVNIDILSLSAPLLPPGFYYLWPMILE